MSKKNTSTNSFLSVYFICLLNLFTDKNNMCCEPIFIITTAVCILYSAFLLKNAKISNKIRPGLVALCDIRPGNGAGLFLQPRSAHRATVSKNWRAVQNRQPIKTLQLKQEAQLMLTNPSDTFRSQSRSPNIVPFHMLCTFPLVQ